MNLNKFFPVLLRGTGQLIMLIALWFVARKDPSNYENIEFYLKSIDTIFPLMIFGNISLTYQNLRSNEQTIDLQLLSSLILGFVTVLFYGFLFELSIWEQFLMLIIVFFTSFIKISSAEIIFLGKTFKAFFLDFFLFQLILGSLLILNISPLESILLARLVPLLFILFGPKLKVFKIKKSTWFNYYEKLKNQFNFLITDFTNQMILNLDILLLSFYSVEFASYAIIIRLLLPINLLTQYSNASFHFKLRSLTYLQSIIKFQKEAYWYYIIIIFYSSIIIFFQDEILSIFNLSTFLDRIVIILILLGKIINFLTAGVGVFLIQHGFSKLLMQISIFSLFSYFICFFTIEAINDNILFSVAFSTFFSSLILNSLKLFFVLKNDAA